MARLSWCSLLVLVALGGCGKDKSSTGGTKAESSTWTFVSFVDGPRNQLAVMWTPGRVGLLAPDGKMLSTIETSAKGEHVGAKSDGTTILINCPENEMGGRMHAVDATTGQKLWSKEVSTGFSASGGSTLAVAGEGDVRLLSFRSGAEVFAGKGGVSAIRFVDGHGFVIQYADRLELVDESGTIRWHQSVERLAKAGVVADAERVYVLRGDRTFEERRTADGVVVSTGTCEGEPSLTDDPLNCAGRPSGPVGPLLFRPAPRGLDGREGRYDYHLWSKTTQNEELVATDRVGRERWRTRWEADGGRLDAILWAPSEKTVALVAGDDDVAKTLLIHDDETGKLLVRRVLARRDRLIGFAKSCWLLRTDGSLKCIDGRDGSDRWTAATSGVASAAWIRGDVVFVADGVPVALSRLAPDGKRTWEREVPDAEITDGELTVPAPPGTALSGPSPWKLSDVMALVPAVPGHTVINLTDGKLVQVK